VTGGNVSFYNESPSGVVYPTPTIGMVGLLADVTRRVPSHFQREHDRIFVAGTTHGQLGGSAYSAELLDFVGGTPPVIDLAAELALQRFLVAAAEAGLLRSAHDCSEGGLAVTVAEAAIGGPWSDSGLGATVDLTGCASGLDAAALLFAEDGARAVLSAAPEHAAELTRLARSCGVPLHETGTVLASGQDLTMTLPDQQLSWSIAALRAAYFDAIPRRME
jgi:phosphoribosylformylglycinamidine synthase